MNKEILWNQISIKCGMINDLWGDGCTVNIERVYLPSIRSVQKNFSS